MKCRYFCRLPLDISPVYLTRGISIGFLVAAIQECWDQDENIPYIVDQDYECTQQTIFDYNEHEEEHQRLNELVKKYLANDIEETDIKMEDRSVVKAMANASKKVEKMKNRDIM